MRNTDLLADARFSPSGAVPNTASSGSAHEFKVCLYRRDQGQRERDAVDNVVRWSFGYTTDLKVVDNKPTTYGISASFNGSACSAATAWSLMPDGTSYAACTTICFG